MKQTVRKAVTAVQAKGRTERYKRRWGFAPSPTGTDWSGYERLLVQIEALRLTHVPGDVLEIGALFGGGTYKLCHYFERHAPSKRVITIDPFMIDTDTTVNAEGNAMNLLYREVLGDRDQRAVFDETTADCRNLTVIAADSAQTEIPSEQLAFAYIDGNHSAEYVHSDFELAWAKLSPGGVIAFDDYGKDLPELTTTLHERVGAHAAEIARVWPVEHTLFVTRL